ncbi:MAG: cysteine hydrolase [Gemmatimonadota bacterium]|nr:cysteine hydrolase [Gemmatimonadota bacterium]
MYTDPMGRDAEGGATYLARGREEVTFPPDRTALLVIDPVNDFLSEGGAAWDLTRHTVRMHNVVENLKRAIEGARERRVPVLFGPMAYTEEDYTVHELHRRSGINRIMFERKMFLAGSWGADFHPDLQPGGDDIILLPHKGTDVFETDLPDHLQRLGVTHLVIAGMTANLCCESTGRHATEKGYDVTFLSNAIGSDSIPSYEAAVHLSYPMIGNGVMEVDEFLAAVGTPAAGQVHARVGDSVRGSDHLEIGKVEAVVPATETHDGYLLVPRGIIFETDTYIPLDAVVRRAGNTVFVNVPRLVVGKMPWSEPPTRNAREAKRGPRAEEVDKLYRSRSPSIHAHRPA